MRFSEVIEMARGAGERVLRCYANAPEFQLKEDRSPLTAADEASHRYICEALRKFAPEIPVISEESSQHELGFAERKGRFWLVDPLDGTKEFLKKTGEFTVNIALVENGYPIFGVVHAPVLDVSYWAEQGQGAWRKERGETPGRIKTRRANLDRLGIVASKDHAGPKVKALIEKLPRAEFSSMGSSLKFCLVAEGKADVYLRDVPTMEWDTAAAQCVVEEAGGSVLLLDGTRLGYGKPEFRNPELYTTGDLSLEELER